MSSAEQTVELETAIQKRHLETTLDILKTLAHEARLNFGREGLRVELVDPGNVAMHYLSLGAGAFEDVPGGQITLGIDLDRLADAIDKAGASDVVTLGYASDRRKLNVSYGNADVNLAAIDTDAIRNPPDDPDLSYANQFTTHTDTLADAIELSEMVSDHVTFECDPEDREIRVVGVGDTDDVTFSIGKEDVSDAQVNADTTSRYSLGYLWSNSNEAGGIVRAMPDGDVTVKLGNADEDAGHRGEYPLSLVYDYADGAGEVTTRLAPRVESR